MRLMPASGRVAPAAPIASARAARAGARLLPLAAGVAAGALLAACGGGGDRAGGGGAATGDSARDPNWLARARQQVVDTAGVQPCAPGTDDAVRLAIMAYVKEAKPRPQRFLIAVGSDSALPDAGQQALQEFGPTFLYPAAAEGQAKIRAFLHDRGDYTTMLVVLREAARQDSTANVVVDGHYVGGEEEGRTAGPRRFRVVCAARTWRLEGSAAEKGA
jgi:hypothetical protein